MRRTRTDEPRSRHQVTALERALLDAPDDLRTAAGLLTHDLRDYVAREELPTPVLCALGILGDTIYLLDDVLHTIQTTSVAKTRLDGVDEFELVLILDETFEDTRTDIARAGLRGGRDARH